MMYDYCWLSPSFKSHHHSHHHKQHRSIKTNVVVVDPSKKSDQKLLIHNYYNNSRLLWYTQILFLHWLFFWLLVIVVHVGGSFTTIGQQSSLTNHHHYYHKIQQSFNSSSLSTSFEHSPSNISASALLIVEQILNEPNLQDAIQKLTEAWNLVHSNKLFSNKSFSPSLISSSLNSSSSKVKLLLDNNVNSKNRSRRWTIRGKNMDHNLNDDDDDIMMSSDDSSIYEDQKKKQTRNNEIHETMSTKQIHNLDSSTSPPPLTIKLNLSCTRCIQDEHARTLRIETIKMNILNKLNMDRAPNVSLRMLPKIPPINSMLNKLSQMVNDGHDQYNGVAHNSPKTVSKILGNNGYFGPLNHNSLDNEEDFFVNAEKSIVFAQTPPPDRIIDGDLRTQYFKFPANIINSHVQKAYLWLYLKGSSSYKVNSWIVIYQMVRGPTPLSLVKSKRISNSTARKGGWVHIRIEKLISKWFEDSETNLGIVIHAYDGNGQQMSVIHSDDVASDSSLRPFMEVRVNKRHSLSPRRKRTIGLNCEDKSAEVRCCRYPLTVDFEQFGWDWIIAPKRYQANYCSGECPFVLMNQYPHTHLIQQINMNTIGPCCSPRKMSSISMLYMDGDYNVIYGIVPNMVVDRCGCS